MKKIFTMLVAILAVNVGFVNSASAQVEQGSIIIDPYYGFPNFGKKLADSFISDSITGSIDVTGIGPCGLRGEYLVSDNFGVGSPLSINKTRNPLFTQKIYTHNHLYIRHVQISTPILQDDKKTHKLIANIANSPSLLRFYNLLSLYGTCQIA